jgi:Ca-activated chloride channel homolog
MKSISQHSRLKKLQVALFAIIFAHVGSPGHVSAAEVIPPLSFQTDQQKPISVTSELVAIPVSVTDGKGNFVPGLGAGDFRIYERNQRREITLFEREDAPVSVGLLVDHSGSMESKLSNVATAIAGFARLSNPQDEMFVVDFGDTVTVESSGGKAFTNSPAEIQRAILGISAQGQTALYDAVVAGLDHLRLAHWQKRALVVVSDGGDNISRHKYSEVLSKARESQVVIYSIGLVDEFGEEENPKKLDQLCKDSGGIGFFPRSLSEVNDSTAHIARDLREQYTLGFAPVRDEDRKAFHRIQVQVVASRQGKLHVRTRPGYSVAVGNEPVPKSERGLP